MPPLPPFDGLHPLVVHFPIALLLFAPVLVVASLLLRAHGRGLALAALLLAVAGTGGAWISVATGEEAAEFAERGATDAVERALEEHEDAAERAAWAFTLITLAHAALAGVPVLRRRELSRRADLLLHGALLAAYAGGGALLADAGHKGGSLVHEHGVRARTAASPAAPGGVDDGRDADADADDDGGRRRRRGR